MYVLFWTIWSTGFLKYSGFMVKTSSLGTSESLESFGFWPVWFSIDRISFAIRAGVLSLPGRCLSTLDSADIYVFVGEARSFISLLGRVSSATTFSCSLPLPQPSLSSVVTPPFFFALLNWALLIVCVFPRVSYELTSIADFDSLKLFKRSFIRLWKPNGLVSWISALWFAVDAPSPLPAGWQLRYLAALNGDKHLFYCPFSFVITNGFVFSSSNSS